MTVYVHAIQIAVILLLAYLVYLAYRADWVAYTDNMKRIFPSFLVWPKTAKANGYLMKIMMPILLAAAVFEYIWLIIRH